MLTKGVSRAQRFQRRLRQRAPVDRRGLVRAAAGADPLPPAGVPQLGSEVGGANEEGSRTHRCHRHSEEGGPPAWILYLFLSLENILFCVID